MTDKEQAIEYIKKYRKLDEKLYNIAPKGTVSSNATKKCLKFWDMAIQALLQEPKWIPVSEELPKIAGVYRVTRYYPNNIMNPNYIVDACFFDGSNTWYNDNRINHERAYVDNVIAWQENPEPYRIESEN